jgi:hypothetical protein
VKLPFRRKCNQKVIIKILWNKTTDIHKIKQKLQAQFHEKAYALRIVQLWIGESCRGRQDLHDDLRLGRSPLNDFNAEILATLNTSPFESAQSIAETLLVGHATVLWHLH